eukprot:TRINITY_DN11857_c0_g2_i1.p1 TRINITY_DN11857_c0_g2~~TRINITY_DN11857_c0_g2_i1.p1  ORF type:complete len:186 (-),score=17.55 TRINITY_DN11857_c0_g2_i1:37-594(-)
MRRVSTEEIIRVVIPDNTNETADSIDSSQRITVKELLCDLLMILTQLSFFTFKFTYTPSEERSSELLTVLIIGELLNKVKRISQRNDSCYFLDLISEFGLASFKLCLVSRFHWDTVTWSHIIIAYAIFAFGTIINLIKEAHYSTKGESFIIKVYAMGLSFVQVTLVGFKLDKICLLYTSPSPRDS